MSFIDLITTVLIVLATYVTASDIVFIAILRFLAGREPASRGHLFMLSRGLGPVLVSTQLYILFRFLPDRSLLFYIAGTLLPFFLAIVYARRHVADVVALYRRLFDRLSRSDVWRTRSIQLVTTVFFVVAIFILGIAYPITEHDSLSVTMETRIMIRDMDMNNYISVGEPDSETGYFARGFRTPFLHMLYLWFAFLGGEERMDILARTVTPVFGLHCLLLVGYIVYRRWSFREASWAVFLLATTPLFFYVSYVNGIDPPRFYLSLLTICWFELLTERRSNDNRLALVTGTIAGFALYSHMLSALAVAAGALGFLMLSRQPILWKRVAAACVVSMTTLVAGAQYHFLMNTAVYKQLERSFSSNFVKEWAQLFQDGEESQTSSAPVQASASTAVSDRSAIPPPSASDQASPTGVDLSSNREAAAAGTNRAPPAAQSILEARGHGGTPLRTFVFGRLQMLTGVEYFGITFFALFASLIVWSRGNQKTTLEKLLVFMVVIYCLVVLSGIRKLSWSNPRYIGTLIPLSAYFAAPLFVQLGDYLLRRGRLGQFCRVGILLLVLGPVVLATSIRGAKVEITNSGTFYQDFRSFRWVTYTLNEPREALRRFWDEYLGIRRTLKVFAADDRTKLRYAHDYFAGVQYINENTSENAQVLVFRDARFFYYGKRRGFVWFHPEIMRPYRDAKSDRELFDFLRSMQITHVLVDEYSTNQVDYRLSKIGDLLSNGDLAAPVFEFGTARVYRLSESVADDGKAWQADMATR